MLLYSIMGSLETSKAYHYNPRPSREPIVKLGIERKNQPLAPGWHKFLAFWWNVAKPRRASTVAQFSAAITLLSRHFCYFISPLYFSKMLRYKKFLLFRWNWYFSMTNLLSIIEKLRRTATSRPYPLKGYTAVFFGYLWFTSKLGSTHQHTTLGTQILCQNKFFLSI